MQQNTKNDGGAGGAGEDADERIERRQHIAREKKRMISAIQAARIAYQARLDHGNNSARRETARTVWRSWVRRARRRKLVFL